MNRQVFDGFLLGVSGVCALGTLLNLAFVRKRGLSAILMALSFLFFGFAVTTYRLGFSIVLVVALAVLVFACLVADFVVRLSKPRSQG